MPPRRLIRLFPRRPLVYALAALVGLGLIGALYRPLLALWQIGALALLALAVADLVLLGGQRVPAVRRLVHPNLPLGAPQRVQLKIRNRGRQRVSITVHDRHPDDAAVDGLPIRLMLDGRQSAALTYGLTALVRGDHRFAGTDLSMRSPFGLWTRIHPVDNPERVRVFPNFGELSHFALLASRNRLSAAGVRRRQRRGQGSDFHQLREYQQGDSLRQIDWKATARAQKLIAREYQDEQNQQLFFLLDCGQKMRHSDAGYQHLDAALNAMLLAAHVAVKQGDAVGFMTFAGAERYLAPRKGAGTLPAMLRAIYDVQSTTRAADFLRTADTFMGKRLRRALVVLVTNTRDGDHADLMLAVRLLQRKHLVIVADLREPTLDRSLQTPVADRDGALRYLTAQALSEARVRSHNAMRHQGAVVIDIQPQQLPLALVNEYFEIKRTARL